MSKYILAPDSFKGSLSAGEVAQALGCGIRKVWPEAQVVFCPVADGGEGTLEALVPLSRLREVTVRLSDGKPGRACYGLRACDGQTVAVIEMARAAGLTLLPPERRDPMALSTVGVGDLIRDALDQKADRILLTVGGSGTNDGGMGLLYSLGVRFRDAGGQELLPCGANLGKVEQIDVTGLDARLRDVSVTLACDVTNPLLGERGATHVFGPQKGVTRETEPVLEAGMTHFADLLEAAAGRRVRDLPGCGAGGGVGFPLLALCGAELCSGIESVLSAAGFDSLLEPGDVVVTGEGRIDGQSLSGKAVSGVLAHARRAGCQVIVVAGCAGEGAEAFLQCGVSTIMTLTELEPDTQVCMRDAAALLTVMGEKMAGDEHNIQA